jgi:hypothetical protein
MRHDFTFTVNYCSKGRTTRELITRPQTLHFLRHADADSLINVHLEEFFYGKKINDVRYAFSVRFDYSLSEVIQMDFDMWRQPLRHNLSREQINLLTKAKALQQLAMMNPIAYDIQREANGRLFRCDQDSISLCYEEVPYMFLAAESWTPVKQERDFSHILQTY